MTIDSRFLVADYFAGIGLMSMGLQQAGWKTVFATDISPKKRNICQVISPETARYYHVSDIFTLDPCLVPQTTLATCSFPCSDLSLAGTMRGIQNGSQSGAFLGFLAILQKQGDAAPPIILVENVPGWLYVREGNDFKSSVKALNACGYACDAFTIDARHFVPQSRLRVFLLGVRQELHPASTAILGQRSSDLCPSILARRIHEIPDARWVHYPIPEPMPRLSNGLSQLLEGSLDNETIWWTQERVEYHLSMMTREHRNILDALANQDNIVCRTFFRRMRSGRQRVEMRKDDVAGCLRTLAGGSARQFLVCAGQGTVRMRSMTPREYARLQGIPEHCQLPPNERDVMTAMGDAVCVPVITWIAENIITPLITGTSIHQPGELQSRLFL